MDQQVQRLNEKKQGIISGGPEKYHARAREKGKMFARDRLRHLLDEQPAIEDGLFANAKADDLPADGVITVIGRIAGRSVAVMANDSTVKAGSWGARTVEKILRLQEQAERLSIPLLYLVDSAGARLTEQIEMFPGRRGAGRIFHNMIRLSGRVPQVCVLLGPSAAGGAYIPAFADTTIMVRGNASMYLGSPRITEIAIGEKVSLEELGGAEMHCSESGCGDILVDTEPEALRAARRFLSYLPTHAEENPPIASPSEPDPEASPIQDTIPADGGKSFDVHEVVHALVDRDSFFETKARFAPEIVTGFARLGGRAIGVVANQPEVRGGVLQIDSADKAARFVWTCDAYNLPLLFLCDVPGFMVGTRAERSGIIRHGAKMISAVSEATVPKISVVLRKAYGAGLYAMCGPGLEPDSCLALPSAQIAVMGAAPAIHAVHYHRIQEMSPEKRRQFVAREMAAYDDDIDIVRLASEMIVDDIVLPDDLREELIRRYEVYRTRPRPDTPKKHRSILPV